MNKEEALAWLRSRKDVLKISAIGRKAGMTNLANIIDERLDGRGYPPTLAEHHLPALLKEIKRIRGN